VKGIENAIGTVLVLLAPIGLLYGWFSYFTKMRHQSRDWRNRITVVSLAVVS